MHRFTQIFSKITLFRRVINNMSTIATTKIPALHEITKHIDIRFDFIRDLEANGLINMTFCTTHGYLADIFAKLLSCEKQVKFKTYLGVYSYESRGYVEV